MKSQQRREGEAVVIVTAMLGSVAITLGGLLLVAVVVALTGLDVGSSEVVFWVLFGCAASVALGYLHRHRRP
jgi:hypothetical protein